MAHSFRVAVPSTVLMLACCGCHKGPDEDVSDTDSITDTDPSPDTDEDSGTKVYEDADQDGYTSAIDCNDSDSSVHPGAEDDCDGADQDCDELIDEDATLTTFFLDIDGDLFGGPIAQTACAMPDGYIALGGDCNDSDPQINPEATDYCDGVDSNCSGNESDAVDIRTFYADLDDDLYGDPASPIQACFQQQHSSSNNLDCDDSTETRRPSAIESCNGIDDNCDGTGELLHTDNGDSWSQAMSIATASGNYTICGTSSTCSAGPGDTAMGDPDFIHFIPESSPGIASATVTWHQAADLDVWIVRNDPAIQGFWAEARADQDATVAPAATSWTLTRPFSVGVRIACNAGTPGPWELQVALP